MSKEKERVFYIVETQKNGKFRPFVGQPIESEGDDDSAELKSDNTFLHDNVD